MSDPKEIDEDMEPEQDKIIYNIFAHCDAEKTGLVAVQTLIDFILPFIDYNFTHLEELREALDSGNDNPNITIDMFYKAMKKWTDKFKDEFQTSTVSIEERHSKRLSDELIPRRQSSTPKKENIPKNFLKDYDTGHLNISNISSYSYSESVPGSIAGASVDPIALQEQIHELQFQNRKLTDLLNDFKYQLNETEEQNTSLKNDLDRLSKRLQAEQKLNENLQKERADNDEYRENTNQLQQKYEALNQNYITVKKENATLKSEMNDFQTENQKLQDIITKLKSTDNERNSLMQDLRTEIEFREQEYSKLEENLKLSSEEHKEKAEHIRNLIEENQYLKLEKKTLDKKLQEMIIRSNILSQLENTESGKQFLSSCRSESYGSTPIPFTPSYKLQHFNYDTPVTRMFRDRPILTSPQLIRMIANPISPISAETPVISRNFKMKISNPDSDPIGIPIKFNAKDNLEISVNLDESNNILCSIKTPENPVTPTENRCTQTPPEVHVDTPAVFRKQNESLDSSSSSSFNQSNPDQFNQSNHSPLDPQAGSTLMSTSLSPNQSFDEDMNWRSALNSFQQTTHESLHSELVHASETGCIGSVTCEHKQKLIQLEEDFENLLHELKEHEINDEETKKLHIVINDLQNTLKQHKTDIETLTKKLTDAKKELEEYNQQEIVLKQTKSTLLQLEKTLTDVNFEKDSKINKLKATAKDLRVLLLEKDKELIIINENCRLLNESEEKYLREISNIKTNFEQDRMKLNNHVYLLKDEMSNYRCQIKELKNRIEESKSSKSELEKLCEIKDEETTGLRKEICSLQEKLKKTIVDKDTSIVELNSSKSELELSCKMKEEEKLKLCKHMDLLNEEIIKCKKEIKELEELKSQNEIELELAKKEIVNYQEEIKELQELKSQSELELEQSKDEIINYKEEIKILQELKSQSELELELSKEEIINYKEEIKELQELREHNEVELKSSIGDFEHLCEIKDEETRSLKHNIESLRKEIDGCKKELEEFMELRERNKENQNKILVLKSSRTELEKECEKKNEEIATLNKTCKLLTEKVETIEKELEKSYETKKEEISILNDECQLLNNKIENYEIKINALETDKEMLMETSEKTKKELINTNKHLTEQLCLLNENYSTAEQQIKIINIEFTKTKEELQETKSNLKNLTKNYAKIVEKSDEIYTTNEATQMKIKNLTEDLKEANNKVFIHETELSELKEENMQHKKDLEYMDDLIILKAALEDKLDTYKAKYIKALSDLTELQDKQDELIKIQEKLIENDSKVINLEKKLKELKNEMEILLQTKKSDEIKWHGEEKNLRNELEVLKKSHAEDKSNWEQIEHELKDKMNKLTQLSGNVPTIIIDCENCETLKTQNRKQQQEFDNLKQQLQTEIEELRIDYETIKSQLENFGTKPESNRNETRKQTRLDLLYHKIEKLEVLLDEEKSKTEILTMKLNSLNTNKDELDMKLKDSMKGKEELLVEKSQLLSKIKKLSHNIEGAELKLQTQRKKISELDEAVVVKQGIIIALQEKLKENETNLNKVISELTSLQAHMNVARQKVKDYRQTLGSNTLCAVNVWKTTLERVTPDSPILKLMDAVLLNVEKCTSEGPMTEEVNLLNNQVHYSCILLKSIIKYKDKFFTPISENSPTKNLETSTKSDCRTRETNESVLSEDVRKKFTLKPATLNLYRFSLPKSMSPEATEMKNETSGNKTLELNNNIYGNTVKESSTEVVEPRKLKTIPEVIKKKVFSEDGTDSSLSSDSSDSAGAEHCVAVVAQSPGDEVFRLSAGGTKSDSEKDVQEGLARQFRSMSEGAVVTHNLTSDGDVSVFPNLRDNVLETMGLLPDSERKERLTDEEIEEKFKMLTLTFAIDAVTLAHRRELQRRQRDQAEENLASEVKRIAQAVRRLHPLCVDAETAELVTSLLSQLDVIVKASSRVATSAEVFGSVQQEWRLAESVNLMLSHLRNLCQQRDTARRQLECTQLMLQKTATSSEPTSPGARTRITSTSGRIVTRRRASIATIPRPVDASRSPGPTAAALIDGVNPRRVTTRRTTCCGELSPSILRGARPSRLDFSLELVKIREGRSETQNSFDDSENEIEFQTPSAVSDMSFTEENLDRSRSSSFGIPDFNISIQDGLINNVLKSHLRRLLRDIATVLNTFWTYLLEHGTINAICCLGIIFCFGMGTIILGSLMLEIEFGFHGLPVTRIPWRWYTWRELLTPFFNRDPGNENLPHM